MGPIPALEMAFTNEQLLTNLRDVEVLAEDVLSDKQVSHVRSDLMLRRTTWKQINLSVLQFPSRRSSTLTGSGIETEKRSELSTQHASRTGLGTTPRRGWQWAIPSSASPPRKPPNSSKKVPFIASTALTNIWYTSLVQMNPETSNEIGGSSRLEKILNPIKKIHKIQILHQRIENPQSSIFLERIGNPLSNPQSNPLD